AADPGQVALEQLVLQRLGASGDDDPPAGQQRRYEVGIGLAGAGPRLRHQHVAGLEGRLDGAGQAQLAFADAEAFDLRGEGAVRTERLRGGAVVRGQRPGNAVTGRCKGLAHAASMHAGTAAARAGVTRYAWRRPDTGAAPRAR